MKAIMSINSIFSQKPEWEEIKTILKTFHQKGFEAVLAGGCVRDALLGKPSKDFDMAVSAPPEEVLKLFPKAKDLWKRYGVMFLPLQGVKKMVEITTFRKDHSYGDGRRPQFVEYTSSAKEDAKRRDFTVNALFYDIKNEKVLDFVGGVKDLKSRLLKTVGEPKERFEEDYLRPLRALRFAHQLNFVIDPKTQEAIPPFAEKLQTLSKERIYSELMKMFSHGSLDRAVKFLQDHSFFEVLFPFKEKPFGSSDLFWKNSFSFYEEPAFVWAVFGLPYFYHAPEKLMEFLQTLKTPLLVAKKSVRYIQGVRTLLSKSKNSLSGRGSVWEKGETLLPKSKASFVEKLRVFELGSNQVLELSQNFLHTFLNEEMKKTLPQSEEAKSALEELSGMINESCQEFKVRSSGNDRLPPPLVTGEDLIKAGYSPGKDMGLLLKKAYNAQLEENISKKTIILNRIFKKNL